MFRLVAALLITLAIVVSASAQGSTPAASCDDQLKIVLKHDQDLDQHRRQLEVRVASQAAQIEDKDREIAKLKADLAKATPKPEEKKK